ncbi:hypothetical protein MUN89_21720 [Halobacillus salinarum]|uniref:Uncharacterized protein n=1 Tax=Halobacillus salinarum TaxID=2932257 RepID=A0ABY4EIT5_9BACI|nr:hypothetical protein [Halobacillus salinarum]UOQ44408.1 hypothetical protein MUN89_21720 [Halobacillus salinarum]
MRKKKKWKGRLKKRGPVEEALRQAVEEDRCKGGFIPADTGKEDRVVIFISCYS